MDDTDEEVFEHKFTVGDFFVALNHDTDTTGYLHINNPNTREVLIRKMHLNNMVDIWRERNPLSRQYPFSKKQTKNYTRAQLDYFLVSENSTEFIKKRSCGTCVQII